MTLLPQSFVSPTSILSQSLCFSLSFHSRTQRVNGAMCMFYTTLSQKRNRSHLNIIRAPFDDALVLEKHEDLVYYNIVSNSTRSVLE